MTFTLLPLFLFLLLVPGILLTTLVSIHRQQLLFSVMFSFACLISMVSIARNYIWNVESFVTGYVLLTSFLVASLMLFRRSEIRQQWVAVRSAAMDRGWSAGLILVAGAYLVWYLVVGPYTEVPADLYRHLEFTKYHSELIANDNFGPPLTLWQLATQHGGFWYVLIAVVAHLSDTKLIDALYPIIFVNGLLFILAVYVFSNELFRVFPITPLQIRAAAVVTCLFVVLQMGVTAFSFVRYYSLAPGMLNMLVYFAALVCVMNLLGQHQDLRDKEPKINIELNSALLLTLCFSVALVMHNQEGLFILLSAVIVAGWILFQRLAEELGGLFRHYAIVGSVVVTIAIAGFALLVLFFDQASIPESGSGKVVALPLSWPDYGPLHILNPKYQFVEVVTIWGGLVIFLFIAWFGFFKQQPLLVAGMLMPLVTVFNPLFVDIFLRVKDDHSLWRLCFVIPLYPVAALFVVKGLSGWRNFSHINRMLIIFSVLLLFLLPFSPHLNRHVRTTNQAVAAENSYHLWQDLLTELNDMDGAERVLTDPVTGYVISALTPHRTFRYRFFASQIYHAFPFVFDSYDDFPLSRYRDWIIVVNQRDGAASASGRASRHWPEDIMKVSKYYPDNLIAHLGAHPDLFDRIWNQNDISVYRIRR